MTTRRRQAIQVGAAVALVALQVIVRSSVGMPGSEKRVLLELVAFALGTLLIMSALATVGMKRAGTLPEVGFMAVAVALVLVGVISPILAKRDADAKAAIWRRKIAPAEAWDR
jgi:hypothetical protein